MLSDLKDPEIQPVSIQMEEVPPIIFSTTIKDKLIQMFKEEEDTYAKMTSETTMVKIDKQYVYFPNQWYFLAVACKKYALALYPYCEMFDKKIKGNPSFMSALIKKKYTDPVFEAFFEKEEDKTRMIYFINGGDANAFRPGKNLFNGNKTRSCKDIFGSCILNKLPVPNASSDYLGNLIYYLAKRPDLYIYLEDEVKKQAGLSDSSTKITGGVKHCAKAVIDYLYDKDGLQKLNSLFRINGNNICIDTEKQGAIVAYGNHLRNIFVKPSSGIYEQVTSKPTVFTDKVYSLNINGNTEDYRLSTEWSDSESDSATDGNNLHALLEVVNIYYNNIIELKTFLGERYLIIRKERFKIKKLPETFQNPISKRFITSLIAKPFVILTGNSGTGKTRIAKYFAQYLEKQVNGKKNWLIVPVGADWTDNTKMLGFYNPLDKKYVSTPTLDFILLAEQNPDIPFFLILDEMNLSHVERYFSDFLSAMESDDEIPLYKSSDCQDDIEDNTAEETENTNNDIPEKIKIPKNLFVTGTVNIDETTYMFSPKVLDRANVVEFVPEKSDVLNLIMGSADNEEIIAADDGSAEAFAALENIIRNNACDIEKDQLTKVKSFLDNIYGILQECNFEFAYRTVKEIRQYLEASYRIDEEGFDIARVMDEQVSQKILPKIYGDRKQIGELLENLEQKCKLGIDPDSSEKMTLSLKKIDQMKKKLDKYQYASFM